MITFIASRLFRALITVFLVMTFAFVVLRMSGDPAQIMLGPDAPQESIDAFRKAWGLDDPIWLQYLSYLKGILSFDFGISMRDKAPAIDLVLQRVPATLQITIPALIIKLCSAFRQASMPHCTVRASPTAASLLCRSSVSLCRLSCSVWCWC